MTVFMHNFNRFLKLDSDEDDNEEDELVVKQEWAMVESKEGGTRYFRGTPTSPPERGYVNRKINLREDKAGTDWWKITKALSTAKRMSNKSEGEQNYLHFILLRGVLFMKWFVFCL